MPPAEALPPLRALLLTAFERVRGRPPTDAERSALDEIVDSEGLDDQDAPVWLREVWMALLAGRTLVQRSPHLEEALWRGGALCASFGEVAPLLGAQWNNEGERAVFHSPEVGLHVELRFEEAPPYEWSVRIY